MEVGDVVEAGGGGGGGGGLSPPAVPGGGGGGGGGGASVGGNGAPAKVVGFGGGGATWTPGGGVTRAFCVLVQRRPLAAMATVLCEARGFASAAVRKSERSPRRRAPVKNLLRVG